MHQVKKNGWNRLTYGIKPVVKTEGTAYTELSKACTLIVSDLTR